MSVAEQCRTARAQLQKLSSATFWETHHHTRITKKRLIRSWQWTYYDDIETPYTTREWNAQKAVAALQALEQTLKGIEQNAQQHLQQSQFASLQAQLNSERTKIARVESELASAQRNAAAREAGIRRARQRRQQLSHDLCAARGAHHQASAEADTKFQALRQQAMPTRVGAAVEAFRCGYLSALTGSDQSALLSGLDADALAHHAATTNVVAAFAHALENGAEPWRWSAGASGKSTLFELLRAVGSATDQSARAMLDMIWGTDSVDATVTFIQIVTADDTTAMATLLGFSDSVDVQFGTTPSDLAAGNEHTTHRMLALLLAKEGISIASPFWFWRLLQRRDNHGVDLVDALLLEPSEVREQMRASIVELCSSVLATKPKLLADALQKSSTLRAYVFTPDFVTDLLSVVEVSGEDAADGLATILRVVRDGAPAGVLTEAHHQALQDMLCAGEHQLSNGELCEALAALRDRMDHEMHAEQRRFSAD